MKAKTATKPRKRATQVQEATPGFFTRHFGKVMGAILGTIFIAVVFSGFALAALIISAWLDVSIKDGFTVSENVTQIDLYRGSSETISYTVTNQTDKPYTFSAVVYGIPEGMTVVANPASAVIAGGESQKFEFTLTAAEDVAVDSSRLQFDFVRE